MKYPSEHSVTIEIDQKKYTTDSETYEVLKIIAESEDASKAFLAVFFLGLKTGRIQEETQ